MEQLVAVLLVITVAAGVVLAFVNNSIIRSRIHKILVMLSGIAIILLIIHQEVAHGFFINFRDYFHHETAELGLATFAIGLLLGKYYTRHRS